MFFVLFDVVGARGERVGRSMVPSGGMRWRSCIYAIHLYTSTYYYIYALGEVVREEGHVVDLGHLQAHPAGGRSLGLFVGFG